MKLEEEISHPGTLTNFKWVKNKLSWNLFINGTGIWVATLHEGVKYYNNKKGNYVDIFMNNQYRDCFIESDIDIAKLKAEIVSKDLLEKMEAEGSEFYFNFLKAKYG